MSLIMAEMAKQIVQKVTQKDQLPLSPKEMANLIKERTQKLPELAKTLSVKAKEISDLVEKLNPEEKVKKVVEISKLITENAVKASEMIEKWRNAVIKVSDSDVHKYMMYLVEGGLTGTGVAAIAAAIMTAIYGMRIMVQEAPETNPVLGTRRNRILLETGLTAAGVVAMAAAIYIATQQAQKQKQKQEST